MYDASDLETLVEETRRTEADASDLRRRIREAIRRAEPDLDPSDVGSLRPGTLRAILLLYDVFFFRGRLHADLAASRWAQLALRLSEEPLRDGSTTEVYDGADAPDAGAGWSDRAEALYEIVVSSTWVRAAFAAGRSPAVVDGRPCADPLDAVQRLLEREIAFVLGEALPPPRPPPGPGWRDGLPAPRPDRAALGRRLFGP